MDKKNNNKNFFSKKKEENGLKINHQIRAYNVKLVGDNVTIGIYSIKEALKIADDLNLDLVEVSPTQIPSVCKIMDYQKYLYDKKKNEKKQEKVDTKEIRLTPNTGEHDFDFKLKHAINFLEKGDRVKVFVFFKGREMAHKSLGADILSKFLDALKDYGTVDAPMKMEGNKMILFFKPKKK